MPRQTHRKVNKMGLKKLLTAMTVASLPLLAMAQEPLEIPHTPEVQTSGTSLSSPDTAICNTVFHSVKIIPSAKLCQSFDKDAPYSLIYFSAASLEQVVDYYQTETPQYTQTTTIQGRILLVSQHAPHRIILSPDNNGTQVDILIYP